MPTSEVAAQGSACRVFHSETPDRPNLWLIPRGVKTRAFLFTVGLSHCGKSVQRAFIAQAQEAFPEGQVP